MPKYMNAVQYFFSDREVAKRYGISRLTVWRWVRVGALNKPLKLGANTTRFRLEDLIAFEEAAMQEGEAA